MRAATSLHPTIRPGSQKADVEEVMDSTPHLSTKGNAQRVGVLRHDELRHVRQRHGRRHRLLLLRPGIGCLGSNICIFSAGSAGCRALHAQLLKQPLGLEVHAG